VRTAPRARPAPRATPADPGQAGTIGADGSDGAPGEDGAPGSDGEDGAPGLDGDDGAPGADGTTLNLKDDANATLGPLVSTTPDQAAVFNMQDPSSSTPYRPAAFIYANGAGRLVTVLGTGVYAFPKEFRVSYENYQAGSPATCSGRVFIDEGTPVSLPGQLFRLGTTDAQTYVWEGTLQAVHTYGIDGGDGCEQLDSPGFTGYEVTKTGTPEPLNGAVHVAVG
jgi:hypothetical protein